MTHRTTDIHLYSASQIPRPPESALKALRPQSRNTTHNPGQPIHEYVSFFYHSVDKSCIPSDVEFQHIKAKSITANEKFKVLKDVQVDAYVDVIVQLVRQPYDTADRITLWISDFTENDGFFPFAWKGPAIRADKPVDPHEYESTMPYDAGSGGEWKGPFGKRSMQVTCYDQHAAYIREQNLSMGSWVMLRNLHIKYGRNLANIEGFLRGERNDSDLKINITQMDTTDTESPDPRLKEALRRKRDYEELKKIQSQEIFNASWAGKKRKSDLAEMGITSSDKAKKNRKKPKKKKKLTGHDESITSSAAVSTTSSSKSNNSNGNSLHLSFPRLLSIFSAPVVPNKISQMRIRNKSHQHLRGHPGSYISQNESRRPGSRITASLCKLELPRGRASHQLHASRSQRFCSAKKDVGICDAL